MKNAIINKLTLVFFALGIFAFQGCTSDDDNSGSDNPPAAKGNAELKLDHVWGPAEINFEINTELTHPATSEAITFTKLRYYVSNVVLQKSDGSDWVEEESYHIVDLESEQTNLQLQGIPAGDYVGISFIIGVDSTRNVSGAQTGALDPAENMFWSWNSGYIFIKAEGNSPASTDGSFTYHIGGFSGPNSAIREVSLDFDENTLRIAPNTEPSVHLMANVARFWHGGISLGEMSNVHMPGSNASILATNFSGGFRFDHIHN